MTRSNAGVAVRLLVSTSVAAALAWLVYVTLPDELDVRTDIVGYPTYSNFNVDRYFWAYGLAVVLFPFVALVLYLLLTRLFAGGPQGRRGPIPPALERVETVPVASGRWEVLVAVARTLFVGGVLGLEAAIVAAEHEELGFLATMGGYCGLVVVAAWLGFRAARRDPLEVVSSINTFAAPVAVLALYGVSESTQVTVSATGAVYDYPWLPLWVALGLSGVVLAWLGLRSVRYRSRAERSALERRALLLVVAPVGLFLFVAALPGALGQLDFFEQGQVLAATELTRDGAFPWRDLLVAHGFLNDVVFGLVGTEVVEDSRWGFVAGHALLIVPLWWIGLYYLCSYLFGANWLFLLGTQLLVVTGHIHSVHARFALLPFVLLLLAALLHRPTVARAVAFTSLLALQVIVAPEALTAAVAYVGALVLFELYYYERGSGIAAGVRRVWLCLATAAVLAVGWSVFLFANRALDDWVFSFSTLVPAHQLTGGQVLFLPLTTLEVTGPILLVLAAFGFVVARTRLGSPLALSDWAMVATSALTLLYYTKFLSRADASEHLHQSFAVAIPLLFYVGYRAITFGEAALVRVARAHGASWFPARHALTTPLLLALLVTAPVPLADAARTVPGHFAAIAPDEPQGGRIGFVRPGVNDGTMIADVSRELESLLEPGDAVFDFSNSPGFFHYLLDLPTSTRYYHVSLAIRRRTQMDLVRLLEEDRPDVVVFTSDGDGFSRPTWDGIANQVRHYEVSEYLLDNYVPVRNVHGYVLMHRRDGRVRARRDRYFVGSCDWGYVPNFFSPTPAPSAETVRLRFRPRGSSPSTRWAVTLPEDGSAAGYRWLELHTGAPLRAGRFALVDRRDETDDADRDLFNTLDRGRTSVRVRIGSCSQWRGYGTGVLDLTSTVPQDVREIRLVR